MYVMKTKRREAASKTCRVYVRVSTGRQAAEGVSLDAQEARARAWAGTNGYAVTGVHVDAGLSGCRADNRPALQEALSRVCQERGALVVYSLSRLARSVSDTISMAGRLERAGADLLSLSESIDTTTAAGKMVFNMLAVLNEFERDLASERTTSVLGYKRAKGERVSRHAPYGFHHDGARTVPDEAEQAVTTRIRGLRTQGRSFRAIVRELNRELVPCRGRSWHLSTVHALCADCHVREGAAEGAA